jgi:hypothetical protein
VSEPKTDLEAELPFGTLRANFSNGYLCCRAIPEYSDVETPRYRSQTFTPSPFGY